MKFKFECPHIELSWDAAMIICFHVVYACTCSTLGELNIPQSLGYLLTDLLQKIVFNPWATHIKFL